MTGYSPPEPEPPGRGLALPRAETVHSDRIEGIAVTSDGHRERAMSTRMYIVLAALTGLAILIAFALQVVLVNR
jgi:hypothetical protein